MSSQNPREDALCNACKTIRLPTEDSLLDEDLGDFAAIHSASLDRFFQTIDCALCVIVRTVWQDISSCVKPREPKEFSSIIVKFCYKLHRGARNLRGEAEVRLDFKQKDETGRLHAIETPPNTEYLPSLKMMEHSRFAHNKPALPLSRTCDLERMKKRLEHCRTRHGDYCKRPKHTPWKETGLSPCPQSTLEGARVIDIDYEYATLSYVWDHELGEDHLKLTRHSSKTLFQTGGLQLSRLPRSVVDAIYVCQTLGLRYLWVDSLCIIQDDPGDVTKQLYQMDQIYSLGIVTLVNASDCKPNEGMRCLRSRAPSQLTCRVDGVRMILAEPSLQAVLERSVWYSRGWTYQEFLLSKRMLVFTSSQAYFVCAVQTHPEDTEYKQLDKPLAPNQRSRNDLSTWVMPLTNNNASPTCWRLYTGIVREYSKRTLSFESDTLNAVAGCLRALGRFTNDTFISGLPAKLFPLCLLWHPAAGSQRKSPWPSWSWAGWKGPAWSPFDPFESEHHRWITTTLLDLTFCREDGSELSIDQSPSEEDLRSWLDDYSENPGQAIHPLSDSDIAVRGRLRFRTLAVSLTLSPKVLKDFNMNQEPHLHHYQLKQGNTWVGSTFLTLEASAIYSSHPVDCECILLARSELDAYTVRYFLVKLPLSEWRGDRPLLFDEQFYRVWSEHKGPPSFSPKVAMNHVMLIKRVGNCVERVAIGIIADCELDWHEEEFILQ